MNKISKNRNSAGAGTEIKERRKREREERIYDMSRQDRVSWRESIRRTNPEERRIRRREAEKLLSAVLRKRRTSGRDRNRKILVELSSSHTSRTIFSRQWKNRHLVQITTKNLSPFPRLPFKKQDNSERISSSTAFFDIKCAN